MRVMQRIVRDVQRSYAARGPELVHLSLSRSSQTASGCEVAESVGTYDGVGFRVVRLVR